MSAVPQGFEPLFRTSPYIDLLGPVYNKQIDKQLVIGFYALEKHTNARGAVHGGVVSSLADIALGYNAVLSTETMTSMVTVNLTVDYVGKIVVGDWVEIDVDVQKVGRKMGFANCYFLVDKKRVARASAVFSVV